MEKRISGDFYKAQKVLKRSLFLILLSCLLSTFSFSAHAFESIFEQNHPLNLSFKNTRIERILDAISQQSGIKIAYSTEELAGNKNVSVNIRTSDIKEALTAVLGDNYTFKQIDNYIAIAKKTKDQQITVSQADDRAWTIQGQVMENSEPPFPLAGVNITIKGTSFGTVSDQNGYFSIKAKRGDILYFNYLGFKTHEYVVSRAISNLTVSMSEDTEELDEVIVTGFSEEKKLNSISSVASLDISKNLNSRPITNLSQSLQGGITGLNVTQGSGLPGADGASISIRGVSTLGNSDPLVLVDGVPMDMNNLDPNTIESITILKDAAAAAIYGSRAANGVIVVKTKRGLPGKINVSYNGYYGIQKATYLPEFANAA